MRVFEIVKENVNLREAAELYGIDVKGTAKPSAPFTTTGTPACMWPAITTIALVAGNMEM
jgi:hypothetical protein